jgi:hypothetical protein
VTDKSKEPGTVHRQKARKQHDCAECADPILKGQSYIYLNTFDERAWPQWSKYILCQECERILNCYRAAGIALNEEATYPAGQLRRYVKSLLMMGGFWKLEFNKAWEASEPAPVFSTEGT